MKTLEQYSTEIQQSQQSGDLLANLLVEMSSQYAYQVEQHTILKLKKVKFEDDAKFYYTEEKRRIKRDKPLSDKATSTKWLLTTTGIEEYHLKKEIQTLEKLMKNLNTIIFQRSREVV